MPHVFISHVEEDKDVALSLAKGIEDAGFATWYYERDTIPGPTYIEQTSCAIRDSRAVLLVLSRASLRLSLPKTRTSFFTTTYSLLYARLNARFPTVG